MTYEQVCKAAQREEAARNALGDAMRANDEAAINRACKELVEASKAYYDTREAYRRRNG